MSIKNYDNGMRAVFNEKDDAQITSVVVQITGGSQSEKNNQSGISEYVARLLMCGTKNYPTKEALLNYAKLNGIILKTSASSENITISAVFPNEIISFALELLSDIVFNYDFDEKIAENVKNGLLADVERLSENHAYTLEKSVNQNLFYRTGLANPKYGTAITVERFDGLAATEYWDKLVTPKNTVVSGTGNLDENEFFELVDNYFASRLPEDNDYKKIKYTSEVEGYEGSLRTRNKRLNQSRISIAFPTYSYKNPKKYLPLIVEPIILNKLRKALRLSSTYFNTLDVKTTTYANNGKIVFDIAVDYDHAEEHLKNFVKALKYIITEDAIGEQEFELEKNIFITNFIYKKEDSLEQSLVNARELAICKRSFNNSTEKLKIEMLTSKDANKYLAETFDLQKMFVSYLGHPIEITYDDLLNV
ncbi:MAG: insulinase family protein [Clostridia bacterium]|nr:insulinase family protein [Clostridia bacterium]